ncbi:MAG: hypothetical protein FJ381_09815 [Verrucomicrobia bacterium]|nr:hypothetical protein [Verrucomicrobiota bacterium]
MSPAARPDGGRGAADLRGGPAAAPAGRQPSRRTGPPRGVFNVTLDRLQNSFLALDRFVADASHELRTPLTTLRTFGEVGLRRGRSEEEYRDIIASMLEESQRLQQLVERLLQLASADGRGEALHPAPVVLDELLGAARRNSASWPSRKTSIWSSRRRGSGSGRTPCSSARPCRT